MIVSIVFLLGFIVQILNANPPNPFLFQTSFNPQQPQPAQPLLPQPLPAPVTAPNYYTNHPQFQQQSNYYQPTINVETESSKLSRHQLEKKLRKYILSTLLNGQPCKDRIAHPNNPHKFIVCVDDGDYTLMDCPGSLVYNRYLDRCDYSLDAPSSPCLSNPCKNSGRCYDLSNYDYYCECTFGHSGKSCDGSPDYCSNNPCGPNGKCNLLPGNSPISYYCTCFGGNYYGTSCDSTNIEYSPCSQSPDILHSTRLHPSLYVQCDGASLFVKMCSGSTVFSPISGRCDWLIEQTTQAPPQEPARQQQFSQPIY